MFSDTGGKNQTVIRQQVIIDTLEVQIRSFHKQLEDIQMERKRFAQTEAMLRGELLSVTSQYTTLKSLYESEVSTLRPQFQEQLVQLSEDRKEMSSLRTDVELSAKRFSQSEETLVQLRQEVSGLRKEKSLLEKKVNQLEQKVLEGAQELKKQKRLLEITLAAKLSSDGLVKEEEKKRKELEKRMEEMSMVRSVVEGEMEKSHIESEEVKRELEELKEAMKQIHENRSGDRAEREAQEIVIQELREELEKIQKVGFTEDKMIEWEEKERLLKEVTEQLRKHKNQLKLALTRVHEMQEEIDGLRLRLGANGNSTSGTATSGVG